MNFSDSLPGAALSAAAEREPAAGAGAGGGEDQLSQPHCTAEGQRPGAAAQHQPPGEGET